MTPEDRDRLDHLLDIVLDVDDADLPLDLWSIGGVLLTGEELAVVRSADGNDWRAMLGVIEGELARRGLEKPAP